MVYFYCRLFAYTKSWAQFPAVKGDLSFLSLTTIISNTSKSIWGRMTDPAMAKGLFWEIRHGEQEISGNSEIKIQVTFFITKLTPAKEVSCMCLSLWNRKRRMSNLFICFERGWDAPHLELWSQVFLLPLPTDFQDISSRHCDWCFIDFFDNRDDTISPSLVSP